MWIVITIGCLECSVPSEYVGTFQRQEEAEAFATKVDEWNDSGDTRADVFFVQTSAHVEREFRNLLPE